MRVGLGCLQLSLLGVAPEAEVTNMANDRCRPAGRRSPRQVGEADALRRGLLSVGIDPHGFPMYDQHLTIRVAIADAPALRRLAALDGAAPLVVRVRMAELDAVPVAAVSLEAGAVTANPFRCTEDARPKAQATVVPACAVHDAISSPSPRGPRDRHRGCWPAGLGAIGAAIASHDSMGAESVPAPNAAAAETPAARTGRAGRGCHEARAD